MYSQETLGSWKEPLCDILAFAPTELARAAGIKHMVGEVSPGRAGWYDSLLRYWASLYNLLVVYS